MTPLYENHHQFFAQTFPSPTMPPRVDQMLNIQANLLHHLSDGTFHLSQAAGLTKMVDVWPRNFPGQGFFLQNQQINKETKAPWMNELIFSQFAPFEKKGRIQPKRKLVPVTIPTIQFSGVNRMLDSGRVCPKMANRPMERTWGALPLL